MIISCPSCATSFTVPDAALGGKGRTLKCARCGHRWFQPGAEAARPEPEIDLPPDSQPEPEAAQPATDDTAAVDLAADPNLKAIDEELARQLSAFGADEEPTPVDTGPRLAEPQSDDMPDLLADIPEPIPDVFSTPPHKQQRRGTGGLWVLLVVLLMAAGAAGAFGFQDYLLAQWPGAAPYYERLGLLRENVGAGLEFRNYNSERIVRDAGEVLIFQGVIANRTGQDRELPLLRLALYDNQNLVQEKIVEPPQERLEPGNTVSFRITVDRPNPAANRFEVTFTRGDERR